jgi:hypothetical protein
MKKTSTAVLLSTLVYPGSGHLYLKHYIQGLVLVAISTMALYFLLLTTVEIAQGISDQILLGEISLDFIKITEMISTQLENRDTQVINWATYSFFICWLIGIVDSYRLACIEDKKISNL